MSQEIKINPEIPQVRPIAKTLLDYVKKQSAICDESGRPHDAATLKKFHDQIVEENPPYPWTQG